MPGWPPGGARARVAVPGRELLPHFFDAVGASHLALGAHTKFSDLFLGCAGVRHDLATRLTRNPFGDQFCRRQAIWISGISALKCALDSSETPRGFE